jgi:disulfide oxidoreductase YuzD
MDPVTDTILAASPALASDLVQSSVKDAYEGLKAVIQREWGDNAAVSHAITAVEKDTTSEVHATALAEKVNEVGAANDTEPSKRFIACKRH